MRVCKSKRSEGVVVESKSGGDAHDHHLAFLNSTAVTVDVFTKAGYALRTTDTEPVQPTSFEYYLRAALNGRGQNESPVQHAIRRGIESYVTERFPTQF